MAISDNKTAIALTVVGLSLSVIGAIVVFGQLFWWAASWTIGLRRALGCP